jgi:hypothetical protein
VRCEDVDHDPNADGFPVDVEKNYSDGCERDEEQLKRNNLT